MPRVSIMQFTKDYQTVVDAFKGMVKNPVVTEREEEGKAVIEIEGDFEHFVLEDMDMWREHLKFEIKDNRITSEDDREARSIISQSMPGFGAVMFSPTIAFVYRRVKVVMSTETIVRRVEDGKETVMERKLEESEPIYDWVDITKEFGRKVRVNR